MNLRTLDRILIHESVNLCKNLRIGARIRESFPQSVNMSKNPWIFTTISVNLCRNLWICTRIRESIKKSVNLCKNPRIFTTIRESMQESMNLGKNAGMCPRIGGSGFANRSVYCLIRLYGACVYATTFNRTIHAVRLYVAMFTAGERDTMGAWLSAFKVETKQTTAVWGKVAGNDFCFWSMWSVGWTCGGVKPNSISRSLTDH